MSRTKKGSKPFGYDYWSKRPYSGYGYGKDIKDMCHRAERMQENEIVRKETAASWNELQEGCMYDLNNDTFYKSLFPKSTKIEYYEDVCGDLVLEVDGKYFGYLEQWEEIMSFQYFTGCNFVDHEDAMKQYSEYLETNGRGDWLP